MSQHRILVIEDQEDLAALYERLLTRAGYRVTNAFSGEEGVAEFGESEFDCVTLDMTLPEMNGMATLASIREASPNVPVVVITGETSGGARAECERLGVFAYLPKPPDNDEVLSIVARALAPEADAENYEVVTLRLPARTFAALRGINLNIEQAIRLLCDERAAEVERRAASAGASA